MQKLSRLSSISVHSQQDGSYRSFQILWRRPQRRLLSLAARHDEEIKVEVKNGLGRGTELKITYPPKPEPNGPVILDLGRGMPTPMPDNYVREISLSANATVVRPQYMISQIYQYPAPIHMTLAAFDWVWRNLFSGQRIFDSNPSPKVGVCGELAGGSLAAMLALTECDPNEAHISAAAIGNPILDWTNVFPQGREMRMCDIQRSDQDELPESKMFSSTDEKALSISAFIARRKEFFRKAEAFFDPFASPTLFFRTPCFDLPYQPTLHPLLEASARSDDQSSSENDSEAQVLIRKRTYPRTYPPRASSLLFPHCKFTVGGDFVLGSQVLELTALMGRSTGRRQNSHFDEKDLDNSRMIMTEKKDGLGLWGMEDALEIGQWFGEVLRRK